MALLRYLIAALVAAVQVAFAFQGWSSGTLVFGSAVQFNQSAWESNLVKPNATGNFSIQGYDVSQSYPGEEVTGWELSVNITSDIPDSQTMNSANGTGRAFTGTSIFMKAPENISANVSNSTAADQTTWKVCVIIITNGPTEDPSTADNGTCGAISQQCSTDFQKAFATSFSGDQDCFGTVQIPSSCSSSINQSDLTAIQYPLDHTDGEEIFVTGSDVHNVGDNTEFNNAVKKVWPVLVVWGWNTRAKVSSNTQPSTQLTCIRADYTEPESQSASSGAVIESSATFAFVVAGVAVYLLL